MISNCFHRTTCLLDVCDETQLSLNYIFLLFVKKLENTKFSRKFFFSKVAFCPLQLKVHPPFNFFFVLFFFFEEARFNYDDDDMWLRRVKIFLKFLLMLNKWMKEEIFCLFGKMRYLFHLSFSLFLLISYVSCVFCRFGR